MYLHRKLGCKEFLRPVDVGVEHYAFFLDVLGLGEREDLESAAVGEDCAGPVHELMKPACSANDLGTGTKPEVVGVGKDNVGTHFRYFFR